jgi:hypothetical protein
MRHWLTILLALALVAPVSARRFNYAYDDFVTEIDQTSDPDTIQITADADDTLVLCTVLDGLGTPTITDDQDNVWETSIVQDGSGHRLVCAVKCDASSATYTVTINPPGGQDMVVTHLVEYSGGDTTSCVQNSASSESASDSSPLTGATVTSTDVALIFGIGVSSVDLTMTTGASRDDATSATSIRTNIGDLRATSATTWNTEWTFSGTAPTLNMVIAIGEAGGGGGPTTPAAIFSTPTSRGGKQ